MSPRRRSHRWLWTFLVFSLAVSAVLPIVVRAALRQAIAQSAKYDGSVDAVWLGFGELTVEGLRLRPKRGGAPIAEFPRIRVSLSLRSLAGLVPEIRLRFARPHLVVREVDGEQTDARALLEAIQQLPHGTVSLEVEDGSVLLPGSGLGQPLELQDVSIVGRNLGNRASPDDELPARIAASARIGRTGRIALDLRADFVARPPRGEMSLRASGIPLRLASKKAEKEEGIAIRGGRASAAVSISVQDGRYAVRAVSGVKDPELEGKPGGSALDDLKAHLAEAGAKARQESEGKAMAGAARIARPLRRPDTPLSEAIAEALQAAFRRMSPS